MLYPLLKAMLVLLKGAPYESVRFLRAKPAIKALIGELGLATGSPQQGDPLDFGDLSAIETLEDHNLLDPGKYTALI